MNSWSHICISCCILFTLGCAGQGAAPTWDDNREVNLLLLAEDGDPDSVPSSSRALTRIMNVVSEDLAEEGFQVYRERDLNLSGGARMRTASKLDAAQAHSTPPLDVAAVVSLHQRVQDKGYTRLLKARIDGRIVNLASGRTINEFELQSPGNWRLHPDCSDECISEALRDRARVLANELSVALSLRLGWMLDVDGNLPRIERDLAGAFTIELDGFTPNEMFEFEDALSRLSGYQTHRVIYSGERRAEYWYETSMASSRLQRNIRHILDSLQHRVLLRYSGSTFSIEKTSRVRSAPRREDW